MRGDSVEWPVESGEFITRDNSLTDSAGLAGIEIEILGAVSPQGSLW